MMLDDTGMSAGCSKRPCSKAAASEEGEAYFSPYVEPLSDARTKLAGFFNILQGDYSKMMRDPGDFILKICKAL